MTSAGLPARLDPPQDACPCRGLFRVSLSAFESLEEDRRRQYGQVGVRELDQVGVSGDQRDDVRNAGQGDDELVFGVGRLPSGWQRSVLDQVDEDTKVAHELGHLFVAEPGFGAPTRKKKLVHARRVPRHLLTDCQNRSYRLADPYDPYVSPRAKHELAREHLDRGLAGVSANDATEAVAWLFLSLEAAIVSVADKHGLDTKRQHWRKADVAKELHARDVLPHDFSDILRLLNEARKVATYEGDDPELEGQSLEDIAADVETAVELAEQEAAS